MGGMFNPVKVSIRQFYGIELNDFAVTVATTALWIAEAQMLQETERIVETDLNFLPLKNQPHRRGQRPADGLDRGRAQGGTELYYWESAVCGGTTHECGAKARPPYGLR